MVESPLESEFDASNGVNGPQSSRRNTLLHRWYAVSGPADAPESASFVVREQIRRCRVASLLILGVFFATLLLVSIIIAVSPATFVLPQTLIVTAIGLFCCLFAVSLNRRGQVTAVGVILIIAVDVVVAGVILSERSGLDPLFLSMFDLLVVAELIAASLLPPASVFSIALLNLVLVITDINLQPHSMMWMQMIGSEQLSYSLILRPALLYFVVAAVAYLWVKSALNALRRADRAELIAKLERRDAERTQQIEDAVEEILAVHVRVANGDLNARAPVYQNRMLWQIGLALNNLLSRFKATAQSERYLQRVQKEVADLRLVLRQWRRGEPLRWYPPGQSLLGPLVDDLRVILTPENLPQSSSPPQAVFPPAPSQPPALEQPRTQANNRLPRPSARDISSHGLPGMTQNQREKPHPSATPFLGFDSDPRGNHT
jgi:hypothetical protein